MKDFKAELVKFDQVNGEQQLFEDHLTALGETTSDLDCHELIETPSNENLKDNN